MEAAKKPTGDIAEHVAVAIIASVQTVREHPEDAAVLTLYEALQHVVDEVFALSKDPDGLNNRVLNYAAQFGEGRQYGTAASGTPEGNGGEVH